MSASDTNEKSEVISKYKLHGTDTGSPEVQVALLTHRLENLSKHFATHRDDTHSQRGMHRMISTRKRLLDYLKTQDMNRYKTTIAALGLRK